MDFSFWIVIAYLAVGIYFLFFMQSFCGINQSESKGSVSHLVMANKLESAISACLKSRQLNINLKPLQLHIITKIIVEKRDVLGVLPTGYGKTLIYSLLSSIYDHYYNAGDGENTSSKSIILVISPLVSLMEDQVVNIEDSGIKCLFGGKEKKTQDECQLLKIGGIPIILMSPEQLFFDSGESWRELFSSDIYRQRLIAFVVDECHCVEQWVSEFRTDYSRIAEIRSILPSANILALTATASHSTRDFLVQNLCMFNPVVIVANCDRTNIRLNSVVAPKDIATTFKWLMDMLESKKQTCPKTVIYCRSIKSCSLVYNYFSGKMVNAYVGIPKAENRLFAMFHHSSSLKCKKAVLSNFILEHSNIRIVIATSAFGMGVNVSDIEYVIHWGASRTIAEFMQEMGRAGRNGMNTTSIVYYHPADISSTATDDTSRELLTSKTCRRDILINHFTPSKEFPPMSTPITIKHLCCDICAKSCSCKAYPTYAGLLSDHAIDSDILSVNLWDIAIDDTNFTDTQTESIRTKMLTYRGQLISQLDIPLFNVDIITGISIHVIDEIITNLSQIRCPNDLIEYVHDETIASVFYDFIECEM